MEILTVIVLTQDLALLRKPRETTNRARDPAIPERHDRKDAMCFSAYEKTAPSQTFAPLFCPNNDGRLFVVFGLQDFAATIVAVRADVVTQMRFTRGRFDCERRNAQVVVGTMHTALGRGLLVLLNGHDDS
jgi:hypothetical protein